LNPIAWLWNWCFFPLYNTTLLSNPVKLSSRKITFSKFTLSFYSEKSPVSSSLIGKAQLAATLLELHVLKSLSESWVDALLLWNVRGSGAFKHKIKISYQQNCYLTFLRRYIAKRKRILIREGDSSCLQVSSLHFIIS
jgi:hypothetical protein